MSGPGQWSSKAVKGRNSRPLAWLVVPSVVMLQLVSPGISGASAAPVKAAAPAAPIKNAAPGPSHITWSIQSARAVTGSPADPSADQSEQGEEEGDDRDDEDEEEETARIERDGRRRALRQHEAKERQRHCDRNTKVTVSTVQTD